MGKEHNASQPFRNAHTALACMIVSDFYNVILSGME